MNAFHQKSVLLDWVKESGAPITGVKSFLSDQSYWLSNSNGSYQGCGAKENLPTCAGKMAAA